MTTIFGKIIKKELPSEIVFEDERVIAIKDINPLAPVHLLIMPKKEIKNMQEMQEKDLSLIVDIVKVAQDLAKRFGVFENYRLITNNGKEAGQEIFHLHFHLIGGRVLGAMG